MPHNENNPQWKQQKRQSRKKQQPAAALFNISQNPIANRIGIPRCPVFRLPWISRSHHAWHPSANHSTKRRSVGWNQYVFPQPISVSCRKVRRFIHRQPAMLRLIQERCGQGQNHQTDSRVSSPSQAHLINTTPSAVKERTIILCLRMIRFCLLFRFNKCGGKEWVC